MKAGPGNSTQRCNGIVDDRTARKDGSCDECRRRQREAEKRYSEKNKDKKRENDRKYREKNREKINEKQNAKNASNRKKRADKEEQDRQKQKQGK